MERTADALPNANMFHISRTEHGIVAQFEVLFEMYESHSHTFFGGGSSVHLQGPSFVGCLRTCGVGNPGQPAYDLCEHM